MPAEQSLCAAFGPRHSRGVASLRPCVLYKLHLFAATPVCSCCFLLLACPHMLGCNVTLSCGRRWRGDGPCEPEAQCCERCGEVMWQGGWWYGAAHPVRQPTWLVAAAAADIICQKMPPPRFPISIF